MISPVISCVDVIIISVLSLYSPMAVGDLSLQPEVETRGRTFTASTSQFTTYDVTSIVISTLRGERLNSTLTKNEHESVITISFTAFNKTFVLLLQRQRSMFSSSYVEKSVTKTGTFQKHSFSMSSDCYYTSADRSRSIVAAFSSCNGFVGYFVTDGDIYHVESSSGGITGKHFVFRESDSMLPAMKCGNVDSDSLYMKHVMDTQRKKRSYNWPDDLDGTTKVVELYVINDRSQYLSLGADVDRVMKRTKDIVNVVNSLYQSQNIYFAITGIEVWAHEDRIFIDPSNASATLEKFLFYRQKFVNPIHPNDNTQLITNVLFEDLVVGKATVGSMCKFISSGAINSDQSTVLSSVGISMAHQIGHNFGLDHDSSKCQCQATAQHCIMSPTRDHSSGLLQAPSQWSSCSIESLRSALSDGLDYCLNNMPSLVNISKSPNCGNGLVEGNEQCDCGSNPTNKGCNTGCCNSTTCRLIGEATCAAGRCCDVEKCELMYQGYECRAAQSDCDLSEYCSGEDAFCPTDVHKADWNECTVEQVKAYCYQGKCRSLESGCKLLWGQSAQVSKQQCFEELNILGSNYGNCGLNWTSMNYQRCPPSDVVCGKLHCTSEDGKLVKFRRSQLYTDHSSVTVSSTVLTCSSVIIDVGMQRQDPGLTANGVQCGEGMACYNQKCLDVISLQEHSCTLNCSSKGVCNSLGQCHCDKGYSPFSNCTTKGCGGSVHSLSLTAGCVNGEHTSIKKNLAVLCILVLAVIALIVVAVTCAYRHREGLSAKLKNIAGSSRTRRERNDTMNNATVESDVGPRPVRPQPPGNHKPPVPAKPSVPQAAAKNVYEPDLVPTRKAPVAGAEGGLNKAGYGEELDAVKYSVDSQRVHSVVFDADCSGTKA